MLDNCKGCKYYGQIYDAPEGIEDCNFFPSEENGIEPPCWEEEEEC